MLIYCDGEVWAMFTFNLTSSLSLNLDLDLCIAGTMFGHFCNGAGRAQCKYRIFTLKNK